MEVLVEALLWGFGYLVLINFLTFGIFAWDKRCARLGRRRVPETTLLNFALIGGSAGAKLAQRRLRHKSYKQPFGRRLNRIVGLHLAACLVVPVMTYSPDARTAAMAALSGVFGIE